MLKNLPTVIFDLGGVYFTDGTERAISIICTKYSVNRQYVNDIFNGELGLIYRENKISINEFWDEAKKKLNIEKVSNDELTQIWHDGYVPLKGVEKIVRKLKSANIETLYLSGSTKERAEFLENKYKFSKHFRDGVFTFEVGVRKPAILPYEYILRKASNIPENCIFIDNKEKYLAPAKELGMHTILFVNSENLRFELMTMGFNFV